MDIRCGTDIAEVGRIKRAMERSGRFASKVFTENEMEYCEQKGCRRYESYAARFAAKEAFLKMLGVGMFAGAAFNEIEIISDAATGAPTLHLRGGAAALYAEKGGVSVSVSISHTPTIAIATVAAICGK